jgi:hypothetical protein
VFFSHFLYLLFFWLPPPSETYFGGEKRSGPSTPAKKARAPPLQSSSPSTAIFGFRGAGAAVALPSRRPAHVAAPIPPVCRPGSGRQRAAGRVLRAGACGRKSAPRLSPLTDFGGGRRRAVFAGLLRACAGSLVLYKKRAHQAD